MKKLVLFIAALALTGSVVAQQTDMRTKKFTFGPKIGLNFNDLNFKRNDNKEAEGGLKVDFAVGAFAEYRTCKWFAVSADLLYSRQGYKTERQAWNASDESTKVTSSTDIRLQYLNIPVLANFYFAKGWALKTGLQPGFLLGSKIKETENGVSETSTLGGLRTFDLAIPIGISYTFKMGLMLDMRYNLSVTNIVKDSNRDGKVKSIKNYGFTFSAGWKF